MTNLGSAGEGGLGILARAEGRRGEWGRKEGMGEGRAGREEVGRDPPRRGWRLSENGDGRLLKNVIITLAGKTFAIRISAVLAIAFHFHHLIRNMIEEILSYPRP